MRAWSSTGADAVGLSRYGGVVASRLGRAPCPSNGRPQYSVQEVLMAGTGRWEEGGGGEKKERAGGTERRGQGDLFACPLHSG